MQIVRKNNYQSFNPRVQASLIDLPRIEDQRGNLTFIEECRQIPFEIKRVYWVYDVPGGKHRGSHALRNTTELIIASSGAFEVEVDYGDRNTTYLLNRSYYGLLVPALCWRSIKEFSTNSLCLILASKEFDEDDYIRDYGAYLQATSAERI